MAMGDIISPGRIANDDTHEAAKFPLYWLGWLFDKILVGGTLKASRTLIEIRLRSIGMVGFRIEAVTGDKRGIKMRRCDFYLFPSVERPPHRCKECTLRFITGAREWGPIPGVRHA